MAVVVQKYGGSSVADLQKVAHVAERVRATRSEGHDVVVVVSAMGKTTEELLALGRAAGAGQAAGRPASYRRELDMLVSAGERISIAVLSLALQKLGVKATSFTGSQSGILTGGEHFDAEILTVRPERICEALEQGAVAVVAGFQGVSEAREITTLGRGGSDTTAVALAAALRAERCEILSDVDGVYTADPRHVPSAIHLPEIGYDDMRLMADLGARVLNARSVALAAKHRLSVSLGCTWEQPGQRRTRLLPDAAPLAGAAVVVDPKTWLCQVPTTHGQQLLRRARQAQLIPREAWPVDGITNVLLSEAQAADFDSSLRYARRDLEFHVEGPYAAITALLPRGTTRDPRVRHAAPNAPRIAHGGRCLTCLIAPDGAERAAAAWHADLCELDFSASAPLRVA